MGIEGVIFCQPGPSPFTLKKRCLRGKVNKQASQRQLFYPAKCVFIGVVEKVRVAFYLYLSVLIIGKAITVMNGDFHLKANGFEFFIEKFVGTNSIYF